MMELAKRTTGAPLSEAEHQQRVDAARARWAAIGAGVAASSAVGGAVLAERKVRHIEGGLRDQVRGALRERLKTLDLNMHREARHAAVVTRVHTDLRPSGTLKFLRQADKTLGSQQRRSGNALRAHFEATKEPIQVGDGTEVMGTFDTEGMEERRAAVDAIAAERQDIRENGKPSKRTTIQTKGAEPAKAHTRTVRGRQVAQWEPLAHEKLAQLMHVVGINRTPDHPKPPPQPATPPAAAPRPETTAATTGFDHLNDSFSSEKPVWQQQLDEAYSKLTLEERMSFGGDARLARKLGIKIPRRTRAVKAPPTAEQVAEKQRLKDLQAKFEQETLEKMPEKDRARYLKRKAQKAVKQETAKANRSVSAKARGRDTALKHHLDVLTGRLEEDAAAGGSLKADLQETLKNVKSLDDVERIVRGMPASARDSWLDAMHMPSMTWVRPELEVAVKESKAKDATSYRKTFDGYPNKGTREKLAERLRGDAAARSTTWRTAEAAAADGRTKRALAAFEGAVGTKLQTLRLLRNPKLRAGLLGAGALIGGLTGYLASRSARPVMTKAFDEQQHPRDDAGRFAGGRMTAFSQAMHLANPGREGNAQNRGKKPVSDARTVGKPPETTGYALRDSIPAKDDPPRVTLLIGMPGAGKSTWRAHQVAARITRPTVVISTDDNVDDVARQKGITFSQAYRQVDFNAVERAQRKVMASAMAGGHDVIVDRANLSPKSRARTMAGVPAHYERHAVLFTVPEDELRRRRAGRPGKIIPTRTLAQMREAFQAPAEGEFDQVHHVAPETLAKAAGDRTGITRDSAIDDAEKETAERLSRIFGKLKDATEAKILNPDGESLHDVMVDGFNDALKPLDGAGRAGATTPIPVMAAGDPHTIAFSMAARSPFVTQYLDSYRESRVVELANEQRDAIKGQLVQAAMAGASPQQMAKRIKETVGLTAFQMQHVQNYRAELEQLDPNVLKRELRDRRFDPTIGKALETGEVLKPEQIDKYVDAYHRRYLAYRATTIARTEGVGAANNGQLAAAADFLGKNPGYTAVKSWIATDDDRTRHDHSELNGQEVVGLETPFVCDSGDEIRWPHDPAAKPRQVINCRCSFSIRIVPVADSQPEPP